MKHVSDSAWLYLMMVGGITVAELRRLNRDTAMPWTVGLLMSMLDAGVSMERIGVTLIAEISQDDAVVFDVIRVYESGDCIASIVECDEDGEFAVLSC